MLIRLTFMGIAQTLPTLEKVKSPVPLRINDSVFNIGKNPAKFPYVINDSVS